MSFRGYFSRGPGQWLRSTITAPSSATTAKDDRTPGANEEREDAAGSATPAAAAAARASSRGLKSTIMHTSNRGVALTSARPGSMGGSSTDVNSDAPVSINGTRENAKPTAKTRNDSQNFGPGPDFASYSRGTVGPSIRASAARTTASASIAESLGQPTTKRDTTPAQGRRRPVPASGSQVDNLISGYTGDGEPGSTPGSILVNKFGDHPESNGTPPRKIATKRKATESRLGTARFKRGRSLGDEEAAALPAVSISPTDTAHPAAPEPEMMSDASPVPGTAISGHGLHSNTTPESSSSPISAIIPTPKRKKSAKLPAKANPKATAKEEEEARILAIETKEEHVWEVETILDETDDEYLINWTPWDKNKKVVCHYPFDWISKLNVGKVAINNWEALDEERKDELREIGKQGKQDLSKDKGDSMS